MPQARDEAGNVWEVDAQGNPVRLVQAAGSGPGSVVQLPPDPMEVNRDARAANADQRAAEAARRAAEAQSRQVGNDQAKLGLDRQKFVADLAAKGLMMDGSGNIVPRPGGAPIADATRPQLSAKERADALGGYKSAAQLEQIIAQLEEQYKAGPGSTRGIAGLRDYLPTTKNQQFDSTANSARGIVGQALGFTGGQLNTATEAQMAVGPYLPQAGDRDEVIKDKINRLRELANAARDRSVSILGGIPDANGRVTPIQEQSDRDKTVWGQTFDVSGPGPGAAPPGSKTQSIPVDPRMQRELQEYIQQNGRNIDPAALAQFMQGLYSKYGAVPGPGLDDYASKTANALHNGGDINTHIPDQEVPMSLWERGRNAAVSNPIGAAAVNYADMAGMGGVSLLDPQAMQAVSDAHPIASTAGQIGGAITGTGITGGFARNTIGRAIPASLGGGARAALMRDLGTDAVYSAVTGANQGQDPALSALSGVGGSLVGRGVGKVGGKIASGLDLPQAVETLRKSGIGTTVGQSLGGFPKKIEDAMTSIPGVGDIIGNRRLEGLQDFNRAAINEAGAPVGATVSNIGESGINELLDPNSGAIGRAYNDATRGVSTSLDPQFSTDMANVARARSRLPEDYAQKFDKIGENRIQPILDAGQLTGDLYQQSMRGLKGSRASASGAAPGFEQEYRDALTAAMDALKGQMQRGGGQRVIEGLAKADQANRLAKTVQQAMAAAKNGTGSGEIQVFTPAQLNTAAYAAQRKYPGARPFAELADAGQSVLPSSIPDSGTARRVAQMALPTALGGGGALIGATQGGQDGAQSGALTGLALAAALGLGGTKAGQRALNKAIFVRPDAIQKAGRKITQNRGLFGSGAIPLFLPIAGGQ